MNKLCCSTLQFFDHPRDATLRTIADLGFREVDIWASGFLSTQDAIGVPTLTRHLDPDVDKAPDIRRQLQEYGLRVHALSIFRCDVPSKLKRIEYAADLGVDTVILCAEKGSYSEFVSNTIIPILPRAESLGVRLAIENHIDRPIDSIASMTQLVREVRSPALGFIVTPPHLAADGESAVDAIRQLGAKVFSFYLWDLAKNYRRSDTINFGSGDEQLPGNGRLDFGPMLEALQEVGYKGPLNLACHGTRGWSIARLRSALAISKEYVEKRVNELESKAGA